MPEDTSAVLTERRDGVLLITLNRPDARNGPLALAASKKIVASALDWDEAEAWQKQGELTGPVFASEDAREGAIAFAEKRAPVWKGR